LKIQAVFFILMKIKILSLEKETRNIQVDNENKTSTLE